MKANLLSAFIFIAATATFAHDVAMKSFVCPLDDTKFNQQVDISGTSFGIRLDLKQVGPIAAPWAVPQCPKCKFVLFKETFDDKDREKLKPFILSDAYQKIAAGNSTYFCLGHIWEFLGEGSLQIAHTYLKASWQVESDPAKNRKYLEEAYQRFAKIAKDMKPSEEDFVTTAILAGELERRLGKFDEAATRFKALKDTEAFKAENLQKVLKREMQFIAAKDSEVHAAFEEGEKDVQDEKSQKH